MSEPEVKVSEPTTSFKYAVVGAICASAPPLLAVPSLKWLGWILLGAAALPLFLNLRTLFSRHMLLLIAAIALLGIVPINTDISYGHMFSMGTVLLVTILLPFIVTKY